MVPPLSLGGALWVLMDTHDYGDGISRFRGWVAEHSPTIYQVIASFDSSMGYESSKGSYALAKERMSVVFAKSVALEHLQNNGFAA